MVRTRGNAILKTSDVSLFHDGIKAMFGEDSPLIWETCLVSPFHKMKVKDLPGATGGTSFTGIILGILVTLRGRCSMFSHSLCSQRWRLDFS